MACGCAPDALCDRCVADWFAQLRGVAQCRGEVWAARVARETPARPPWPAHEGRAAELARRKVADLASDPRLRELLAAELSRGAARRWRQEIGAAPSLMRLRSPAGHAQYASASHSVP